MRVLQMSLLAAVMAAPQLATAQTRDYAALRDSLARETDAFSLRDRIRSAGPANPLERGFLLLRLYELTSDQDVAEDARETFTRAVDASPSEPWAHYGLAVSLADGPELGGPGILRGLSIRQTLAEIQGTDPRAQARESLQRALDVDPAFTPAAVELAELALETRERDELSVAREALVGLPPASVSTLRATLALADVEAALGNLEEAEKAAAAAVSAAGAGDDASLARHLHAVSLLRQPGREEEGASVYFEGLGSLTEAGAERYYRDAEWLATDAEQFRWRTGELEARREWLRDFWTLRAAESGLTPARRLAEHYRRLAMAYSRYLRTQHRGIDDPNAVLWEHEDDRPLFDDRGLVYIRYGEPARKVATTGGGLRPNESWLYYLPDGSRRFFHFTALSNGHDFSLVDNLLVMMEPGVELASAIALFDDRAEFDDRYLSYVTRLTAIDALARTNAGGVEDRMQTLLRSYQGETGRHRMELLTNLEDELATPAFDREMPFYYDVYAFRGDGSDTELTATFAVPGNMVEPAIIDGRTIYPLQASFIVIDTASRTVARVDSTFRFAAPRRLQSSEHIRFDLRLDVAPRTGTIHRALVRNAMHAGEGKIYGGPLAVPDLSGGELTISELVLARASKDGEWMRGNARLELMPPRQFAANEPFRVFYEVYNLRADAAYRTEITVEATEGGGIIGAVKRLFGGRARTINVAFDDVAPDVRFRGGVQELRDLQVQLDPGRYRMRVEVTELESGRAATRERLFIVLEEKNQ